MMNKRMLFLFLMMPFAGFAQVTLKQPTIDFGVSKALADFRSTVITDIHYQLSFDIPLRKTEAISANEQLSFNLLQTGFPLQLDFKADPGQIKTIEVNGKSIAINYQKEHIILPAAVLTKGKNNIRIAFIAGNAALNRNDDYLYTLFVPDRARTSFPCFDQPDLKATYQLSLTLPEKWEAISNGSLQKSEVKEGRRTVDFATSDKISTYLFSFTAGKFKTINQIVHNQSVQFLYRETDTSKINLSIDSIFQEHRNALDFLTTWTTIPYPFKKIGFVAIPDFQFGGMEHPGAVQYQGSTLFLDSTATKTQFISRANLISHETAHMWFGDLVSIKWFNDVWTKEVFANFMADKVSEHLKGKEAFDHKFLIDHFPAAYGIDRTKGANPIRQPLDNLNEAGSLYGNIIYHKAPIMMRQLELLMGKEKFQKGMREYLKKFSFSNASWPDLINILNKYAPVDLIAWNKVWVDDNGRPRVSNKLETSNGKITRLTISQKPEFGGARLWPQSFKISLYYKDHVQELPVNLSGKTVEVTAAVGLDKPEFIVYNSGGEGYGVWPIDLSVLTQTNQIVSPLVRASFYIAAYEKLNWPGK
jgi:aminopeptidase N